MSPLWSRVTALTTFGMATAVPYLHPLGFVNQRLSLVGVLFGAILWVGGCSDSYGLDPCADHSGYALAVSAVDQNTGEPVRGFAAWVDRHDGETLDTLTTIGSTATWPSAGEYFVNVRAATYEPWQEHIWVPEGPCGPETLYLTAELIPMPVPARIELEPAAVEVEAGMSAEVRLTVRVAEGAIVDVPVEWLVRDSAVAEVLAYDSSGFPAPPLVYGSSEGATWMVVASGTVIDSLRVVVTPASPLGVNEGMIETEGRWLRRYRVPIESDYFHDSSLLWIGGWTPAWDCLSCEGYGEAVVFWVPWDSMAPGTRELPCAPTADCNGQVDIQAAPWSSTGDRYGPNSQRYVAERDAAVVIDSVRVRSGAPSLAFGTLSMDSATEYTLLGIPDDVYTYQEDTGRKRNVRVEFIVEVVPK